MLLHARGLEHQSKGVENCLAVINHRAGHRQHRARRRGLHHDHRPGQRPGRPRARPEVRPAARPAHPSPIRRRASTWPASGASRPTRFRRPGYSRRRDHERDPPRRDQGAALDLLQSAGLAARRQLHARGAGEARVLRRHRLLPLRDRAARRRGAGRQPAGGGGGRRRATWKARVIHIQKAVDPPGNARARFATSSATWRAAWAADSTSRSASRARSSRSCAWPRAAASPTTTASPTRRSTRRWASSGRARRSTIPARRACSKAAASSTPTARRASWSRSGARAAIRWTTTFPIYLTTGRVVSQYLSGTQTRRIGALVDQYPEPQAGDPSAAGRAARHPDRRLGDDHHAPQRDHAAGDGGAHHPAGHRLHPYHWPGERSANG